MRSPATASLSVTLLLAQMQVLQADDAHHQPKTNQSAKTTPGISTQTAKKVKAEAKRKNEWWPGARDQGRATMTKLPYLRTMFATCMLFQVIYVACVLLWITNPDLKGHALLPAIFPNFTLLTIGSFIYGLVASMIYGWITAIIFVFFFNLWPTVASVILGPRAAPL